VTLGRASGQAGLWDVAVRRCEASLPERSIYRLLHAERDQLFPDELFANLFIHQRWAPVGAAVGGRGGDGPATPGRPVGSGGGRPGRIRPALAHKIADLAITYRSPILVWWAMTSGPVWLTGLPMRPMPR
jgi:hypothetical protein